MPKQITTVAIGDIHAPWFNRRTIAAIISLVRKIKPKRIVQLGDAMDLYSFSSFARSLNILTPQEELKRGRRDLELIWKELRQASPKAECHMLKGNHDARIIKRVIEKIPEAEHFLKKGIEELWRFDGVNTLPSDREELILDGVCFMHGFRQHGQHMLHNGMSTVCGHLHRGGVVYSRLGNKTIFELNVGYVADSSSVPLSYSKQLRFSKHTQGVGLIDEYGPRFIAL